MKKGETPRYHIRLVDPKVSLERMVRAALGILWCDGLSFAHHAASHLHLDAAVGRGPLGKPSFQALFVRSMQQSVPGILNSFLFIFRQRYPAETKPPSSQLLPSFRRLLGLRRNFASRAYSIDALNTSAHHARRELRRLRGEGVRMRESCFLPILWLFSSVASRVTVPHFQPIRGGRIVEAH